MTKIHKTFGSTAGFLNWIWVGDHLDPAERIVVDALATCEKNVKGFAAELAEVGTEIDVCDLNQPDGGEVGSGEKSPYGSQIINILGKVSHGLDKTAAKLDTVSTKVDKYRKKRKGLAERCNKLMTKCDKLIDTVGKAKERERMTPLNVLQSVVR